MQRYGTVVYAAGLLLALQACAGQQVEHLTLRVENLEASEQHAARIEERLTSLEEQSARLNGLLELLAGRLEVLDQMSTTLAALEQRLAQPEPQPQRPRAPDPAAVYAVPVGDSPVEGPASARITIVNAFEFACPFCERSRATLDQIRRKYGKNVRIVYKHFIVHPSTATIPARAACAAHEQGKFTAMKDAIWERGFNAGRDLSEENMRRQAKRLGLNMRRFERDMDGPCAARVQQDHAEMARLGVTGTPNFYVNGRAIRGAQPFQAFRQVIDEELAKANEIIRKQGIKPGQYYEKVVLANGRTGP